VTVQHLLQHIFIGKTEIALIAITDNDAIDEGNTKQLSTFFEACR
jgi:hypothetical protein